MLWAFKLFLAKVTGLSLLYMTLGLRVHRLLLMVASGHGDVNCLLHAVSLLNFCYHCLLFLQSETLNAIDISSSRNERSFAGQSLESEPVYESPEELHS